ncbi:unnamed protein product [Cylicocyclus nassatus]|uniref:Uncharacterized protein n=1 Tax=Cylicocyclus nassatus TaxID=53992 RepID=A0AA36M3I4_CYLNA|nr:unnamed protein product [Cylicocyclus nassatus]
MQTSSDRSTQSSTTEKARTAVARTPGGKLMKTPIPAAAQTPVPPLQKLGLPLAKTAATPAGKKKHRKPKKNETDDTNTKQSKEKESMKVPSRRKPQKGNQENSPHHKSEASDESSSEESEEIVVYETPENQSYERKVILGNLSRVMFREPFWHDKISAYAMILSYLITYDVVAHFFFYTHYFGITWTFTYGFCMLVVGFPMCYLEMALGQYTSTGVYLVFDRMTPAFVGVGVSSLIINFFTAAMDYGLFMNGIGVIHEAVVILNSQMPWHHCLSPWSKPYCHVWSRDCSKLDEIPEIPQYPSEYTYYGAKQFVPILLGDTCVRSPLIAIHDGLRTTISGDEFEKFKTTAVVNWANSEVHDFTDFKNYTYMSPKAVMYAMIFVLICIFILSRTRRTVATFISVSLLLVFCMLSFLLHGILTMFSPKYPYALPATMEPLDAVNGVEPWLSAILLTMRSLKLGQGGLVFLGAQNGFHNNLIVDCLLITLVMIFVPFFYSLFHIIAMDSYVLEMVKGAPSKVKAVVTSKNLAYQNPVTIAIVLLNANHIFGDYEPVVTFWYGIIMLCTVLSSKIVRYEITINAFLEGGHFNNESSRFILVVLVVLFTTLLSLIFQYTDGYMRAASISFSVIPIASAAVVILEVIVIGFFYGFRVFYSNTSLMVYGYSRAEAKKFKLILNSMALVLWSAVIPVAILFSMIALIYEESFEGNLETLDVYNWLLIAAILSPVPIMLVYLMYYQSSQGNSIHPLFKRNPDLWGPRSRANRQEAEKAERMIRKWW